MAVGEWDQRQLCPDGGCVGVIGPDGTCKVCGRAAANWGDERKRGLLEPSDGDGEDDLDLAGGGDDRARIDEGGEEDDDEDEDDEDDDDDDDDDEGDDDDDDDEPPPRPTIVAASPGEWSERALCPDGSCIGVIGADGRCKVCGRAAAPEHPEHPEASPDAPAAAPASADAQDPPVAADPDASPSGDPASQT